RARGDRGAHVALAVHDGGEAAHLLDGVAGLVLEGALRPLRDDEMAFDVAPLERLEHPDAEYGAGRAGHADDETTHSTYLRLKPTVDISRPPVTPSPQPSPQVGRGSLTELVARVYLNLTKRAHSLTVSSLINS